jgi:trehalose 6-phosphate synthase
LSRLVVISNRVPMPEKNGNAPAGGLAVALQAALEERGGVWMGWSGKSSGGREPAPLKLTERGNITYALTDLTQTDVDEYYHGFANRVLWPICHYRLDLAEYARKEMAGYFRVNRFFAHRVAPLIQPDDVLWVHDYHLIPLAAELRQMGFKNKIGFFLHIPWPPADVLFAMPVHEEIMRGLSHYDLVGFQTDHDLENFRGCLVREGFGNAIGDGLFQRAHLQGRFLFDRHRNGSLCRICPQGRQQRDGAQGPPEHGKPRPDHRCGPSGLFEGHHPAHRCV